MSSETPTPERIVVDFPKTEVMNGFFVIGLSADDTDVQRNEQLLKDRSWFDIPIVYINGVRAILAMEKGSQGDRTFAEVFAAWENK